MEHGHKVNTYSLGLEGSFLGLSMTLAAAAGVVLLLLVVVVVVVEIVGVVVTMLLVSVFTMAEVDAGGGAR